MRYTFLRALTWERLREGVRIGACVCMFARQKKQPTGFNLFEPTEVAGGGARSGEIHDVFPS